MESGRESDDKNEQDARFAAQGKLHAAVWKGSREDVVNLVNSGCDVNAMDNKRDDYCSPLHLAVVSKQQAMAKVRLLVLNNAELDAQDSNGFTPLHRAVELGDSALSIVEYLVSLRIPKHRLSRIDQYWDTRNANGDTVHDLAVKGAHENVIHFLRTLVFKTIDQETAEKMFKKTVNKQSRTLLLRAAIKYQRVELVREVLKTVLFDLRGKDSSSLTARDKLLYQEKAILLRMAVESGNEEIIEYLVANGIRLNIEQRATGKSKYARRIAKERVDPVLKAAVKNGDMTVIRCLEKLDWKLMPVTTSPVNRQVMELAVQHASVEMIAFLLERGFKLNYKNESPVASALMSKAVQRRDANVIRLLVERGIAKYDESAQRDIGGRDYILEHFIAHGLPVHEEAAQAPQRSVLNVALRSGRSDLIQYLEDDGILKSLMKGRERSLLKDAMKWKQLAIFKDLVRRGLDVAAVGGKMSQTLLHVAVKQGDRHFVSYLLDEGLDLGAKDTAGETALHVSVRRSKSNNSDWRQDVQFLLSQGAENLIDIKDDDGWSVLHDAAHKQDDDLVQLLLEKEANTDISTEDGSTPISLALTVGPWFSEELVNILFALLSHGAAWKRDYADVLDRWAASEDTNSRASDVDGGDEDEDEDEDDEISGSNHNSEGDGASSEEDASDDGDEDSGDDKEQRARGPDDGDDEDKDSDDNNEDVSDESSHVDPTSGKTDDEDNQDHEDHEDGKGGDEKESNQSDGDGEESDDDSSVVSGDSLYRPPSVMDDTDYLRSYYGAEDYENDSYDPRCEMTESEVAWYNKGPRQDPQVVRALVCSVKTWLRERAAGYDLTPIPWTAIQSGPLAVEAHFRELGKSVLQRTTYYQRVCVLGASNSGKTSLVKSIKAWKPYLNHRDHRHVGIDVVRCYQGNNHVAFWDVQGLEVFQGALSRFFPERTVFMVCVDLREYAKQMRHEETMDRFVSQHILKWIRLIATRHKNAEFLVVGTKSDRLKDPTSIGTKIEADFRRRVAKWKNTFADDGDDARDDDVFGWDTQFEQLLAQKWVIVSCKNVAEARDQVLNAIIDKGEHRFPLGPKHTKILRVIQHQTKGTRRAVDMVDKRTLFKMMKTIDDLTVNECIACLNDLHALGKVWFPREGAGNGNAFARTAFLSPTIVAQSLNEIVKLGQTEGRVAHDSLKQCRLWEKLDDNDTLQLKCSLLHLQLAYPAHKGKMTAESDMIVPACWDDRKSEELGPLTKQESLLVRERIVTNASVCWEYELSVEVSETVFTQFACECKDFGKRVTSHRTVFHDVVNGDVSAVAAITSGIKDAMDVIRVEVAGKNCDTAWRRIVPYAAAMGSVLGEYPGVPVSQYTVDTKGISIRHSLQEVTNLLDTEDRSGKKIDRKNKSWLPPRGWLAYWNDQNQLRKQDANNETQETLAAIHNSVISDPTLRLFPAIWTLKCSKDKKQVEVRMLSDYSYKCCHENEPIVLSLPPKFLADHGSKLQVGLSFLSNVLPDFVSMDLLQPHIDAVVNKATTLHNMMQGLESNSFKSTDKNMTPGEAVIHLQNLLALKMDHGFHPLMIPKMSGLEPAVNVEGHFVWASREEIDASEGDRKLTPCSIGRSVPSPSPVSMASAISTVSAKPTVTYKLVIEKITVLNDLREIFCHWELIDESSLVSKTGNDEGKTSEPTDDTDPLATSSVATFDLEGVQSNDQLLECQLVVRVNKKPSSLSRSLLRCSQRLKSLVSGTVIGVGEVDKLTVDKDLSIPVVNPKTKAQVAMVTCRITIS